jgi:vacuolar iron transporter family protein
MEIGTDDNPQHWHEDIGDDVGNRLNWLRAGVLGANDGIVSTAGIVMGVAGATSEAEELKKMPETEQRELAKMYERKGLSRETARKVAQELTDHDALAAHADIEFGIDPDNLTNAWHAAFASMVAFTIGALLPLLVITLSPLSVRVWATVTTVAIALAVAGFLQAKLGFSPRGRAVARNVVGGLLAMVVTYGVGSLVGAHI